MRHEQYKTKRYAAVEAEATNRACVLAHQANCPLYVVHVMCKDAARTINEHRARGAVIFGESTAAGLATDGTHYYHTCWRHAAGHIMSPPLSDQPDTKNVLMQALAA